MFPGYLLLVCALDYGEFCLQQWQSNCKTTSAVSFSGSSFLLSLRAVCEIVMTDYGHIGLHVRLIHRCKLGRHSARRSMFLRSETVCGQSHYLHLIKLYFRIGR